MLEYSHDYPVIEQFWPWSFSLSFECTWKRKISIEKANLENVGDVGKFDRTFFIESKLVLNVEEDATINYRIGKVPRYKKRYTEYDVDYETYIDHSEKIIYLAYVGIQIVGQIIIRKN